MGKVDTRKTAQADKNPKNPLLDNVNAKMNEIHENDESDENLLSDTENLDAENSRLEDSESENPVSNEGLGIEKIDPMRSQSTPLPPQDGNKKKGKRTKTIDKEIRYNEMKNRNVRTNFLEFFQISSNPATFDFFIFLFILKFRIKT